MNFKKKISNLLVLAFIVPVFVNAKMVAYSVGTNYGLTDIDTSSAVKYATEAYYSTGLYSAFYNTKPTSDYLRGNNPNTGNPRLESNILFFNGHGNYDHMAFNYLGKGDEYACGVYKGYNIENNGYTYVGLKSYDMNKVDMAIFAGCLTGKEGVTNIADVAVLNGATVSIGWRTEVTNSSLTNWSKRFNKSLAEGNTLWDAVEDASASSYLDNNVKNMSIYGDFRNYKITNYNTTTTSIINNLNNLSSDNEYDTSISFTTEEEFKEKLSQYIIENIDNNFDISQYKEEINNTLDTEFYDYKYVMNGVVTNSAITVLVRNNEIIKIVDNRVNISNATQVSSIDTSNDEENIINTVKEKILQNENLEIESQTIEKIYNENDNIEWYVRTVIYDKITDTYFVDEYYEKI